jgi:hypothetical protein
MAAGLGFKTFNTGDVLSAADTNGYLMQGVLVFANAAARDAAITSPQEGQACYLKDTDGVLTYSGSAWVAVGGGGGGGGGMTLLSTTSLTGASTTVGSINQTYKDLIVIISGMSGATNGQDFQCAPNGTTNIAYQTTNGRFSTTSYNDGETAGYVNFTDGCGHNNSTTVNSWTLRISQYAATDKGKPFAYAGYFQSNQSGAPLAAITAAGGINTNTAISSLVFSMSSGNLSTGTVLVYGVN